MVEKRSCGVVCGDVEPSFGRVRSVWSFNDRMYSASNGCWSRYLFEHGRKMDDNKSIVLCEVEEEC